jgi:hypothetical protein
VNANLDIHPPRQTECKSPELILLSKKRRLDMQLIMPLVVAYMAAENHSQTSGVGVPTAHDTLTKASSPALASTLLKFGALAMASFTY